MTTVLRMLAGLAVVWAHAAAAAPTVVADFTRPGHGWRGNGNATIGGAGPAGLPIACSGEDPWVVGPAVAVPDGGRLAVRLRTAAVDGAPWRLYVAAADKTFTEDAAAPLVPLAGEPGTLVATVARLAERMRFRLDPPAGTPRAVVVDLSVEPLLSIRPPLPVRPQALELPAAVERVAAGSIALFVDPLRWNALAVEVDGQRLATTVPDDRIAWWDGSACRVVDPEQVQLVRHGDGIVLTAEHRDGGTDPATWRFQRAIRAAAGAVEIVTTVTVDRPRDVVHLPWLSLVAGVGSFGPRKTEALLPGVEYLEDEPSGSEAEIRGAAADRRLVDPTTVCSRMLVLAARGRWLAVDWFPGDVAASPLLDSPDRTFDSGAHLLGLWSPAVGPWREQGSVAVQRVLELAPDKPLAQRVRLRGGPGDDVALALADRVARDGLPAFPVGPPDAPATGLAAASRLLAHGWLDSAARDGTRWRHAVWGESFPPQPAEDAPVFMGWLSRHVADEALAARLETAAREAIVALPADTLALSGVGHAGRPVGPLVIGDLPRVVRAAAPSVMRGAARLAEQGGRARYAPGADDLAATLGADHCNGLTAIAVEALLEQATLTGDEQAIAAALAALAALDADHPRGVPRGAQPWEIPLHAPDILAAARLVRCFVLGHLLSGDGHHLARAREWAWRGATMVVLDPPTPAAVGIYATTGVIGATHWTAPNWIGQPVQWCGLVYAAALVDLARIDGEQGDTWGTLAAGITRCGLAMTFPRDDARGRGGLLPDFWLLAEGRGDGPAINPGTLQASLADAFNATPLYSVTRLAAGRAAGGLVHVAGATVSQRTSDERIDLELATWPDDGCRVLLSRVPPPRSVTWNGVSLTPTVLAAERSLIVPVRGSGRLSIGW